MSNLSLAVVCTFIIFILGASASGLIVAANLFGQKLLLASLISVICLPLGVAMAHQTFQEFNLRDPR